MKNKIGDYQRLRHIYDACVDIERAIKDQNKEIFVDDYILRAAVCNFIIVIGEAVATISDELKESYQETDWRAIKGMRNIIVHHYFGIDYAQVWESATTEIPQLKLNIENILKEFE